MSLLRRPRVCGDSKVEGEMYGTQNKRTLTYLMKRSWNGYDDLRLYTAKPSETWLSGPKRCHGAIPMCESDAEPRKFDLRELLPKLHSGADR